MKPIETKYDGYRFRSRLEARWAVFFNSLNIRFEYEPQGFDLGDAGWYLPDFWLPEQKVWIEIKGEVPEEEDIAKPLAFAKESGDQLVLFFGQIRGQKRHRERNGQEWVEFPICGMPMLSPYPEDEDEWNPLANCSLAWSECGRCGEYLLIHLHFDFYGGCTCEKPAQAFDTPALNTAYAAARQARFEHGESG